MLGIIGAMDIEIERITDAMTDKEIREISGIIYTKGKINGKDVVCAVCGIGKVFAAVCAQTMILNFSPDYIINTGIAGTLTTELTVLDTIVATGLVQHDMDTTFLGDPPGLVSGINVVKFPCDEMLSEKISDCISKSGTKAFRGIIASGDCFVADGETKKRISSVFDAKACEMEGAAIGHVCFINNVPCSVVRTISDGADDEAQMSYNVFREKAAEKSAQIIIELISSSFPD